MTDDVVDREQPVHKPYNRFHPEYESFTEWLDAEAPPVTPPEVKRRNAPSWRRKLIRRAP